MFIDPIRSAIYRLAPGPVKNPETLAYLAANAKALGMKNAAGDPLDAGALTATADHWAAYPEYAENDNFKAAMADWQLEENLRDRQNELLNNALNWGYSAGQRMAIPGAVAGMGASVWNTMVNSDQEVNGGDIARAAAVLGGVGGLGLTAARLGTGRRLTLVGPGHDIGPGLVFATPDQRTQLLRDALSQVQPQP